MIKDLREIGTWILVGILLGMFIMVLSGCSTTLPHRPDTMNNGQGHNPSSACGGQYHMYVQSPDGDRFFLECWGQDHL